MCDLLCFLIPLCANVALAQTAPHAQAPMGQRATSAHSQQLAPPPSSRESTLALEARVAFTQGLAALRAAQWVEAEVEFRRSLRLVPRDSTKYNLAFVLFKQSRLRASSGLLRELLGSAAGDSGYRQYAEALLPLVLAELATLRLLVEPPHAELTIDGEPSALQGPERSVVLDPGSHRIDLTAAGFVARRVEFRLEAHAGLEQSIELRRVASQALTSERAAQAVSRADTTVPSRLNTIGPWIAIGTGSALLVASAVTGILAKRTDDDFVERCPTLKSCDPALTVMRDKALRLGTATDVLLGSGLAVALGGVTWRLLAPRFSVRPVERAWAITTGARF